MQVEFMSLICKTMVTDSISFILMSRSTNVSIKLLINEATLCDENSKRHIHTLCPTHYCDVSVSVARTSWWYVVFSSEERCNQILFVRGRLDSHYSLCMIDESICSQLCFARKIWFYKRFLPFYLFLLNLNLKVAKITWASVERKAINLNEIFFLIFLFNTLKLSIFLK